MTARKRLKNKQPIQQQKKYKPPNFPSCKRNNWLEFDKGYYCQNCENNINKQKDQIDKKVRRQDQYIPTRLAYADKKLREKKYSVVKTSYSSSEDMIDKLKSLGAKTNLKFYQNISKYYDEMNIGKQNGNFQFEEDLFSKDTPGISKIYHEVIFLMKFLQTKIRVKNMNINYYDLYYTVFKNRDDKEIRVANEKIYNNFNEYIAPNHYIGQKNNHVMKR